MRLKSHLLSKASKYVTRAQEAPLYNKLPENKKQYALFTDASCHIVGNHQKWEAAIWSPTQLIQKGPGPLRAHLMSTPRGPSYYKE